jgi:two-component sensor histidine kinase
VGTGYIGDRDAGPAERRVPSGNRPLSRIHRFLFVRHGRVSIAAAIALYAAVILLFGSDLAVSGNYFIALPVLAAAFAGGKWAGLAAGALGLPANLALFALIGHPEFSPASKPIAEGFGLVLGFALGYLADYYGELEKEICKRAETEASLRKAVAEKELLLKELHHRVKNNLTVIKSLVQLQRNRSGDAAFRAAADELVNRIRAISLAHDQLYAGDSPFVDPKQYLEAIAANVSSAFAGGKGRVSVDIDSGGIALPADRAVPLGLVANEALTNAMKHARPEPVPRGGAVSLSLRIEGGEYVFRVVDDGLGPSADAGAGADEGLGMKIIRAFASQLGGRVSLRAVSGGGAALEMRWPAGSNAAGSDATGAAGENAAEAGIARKKTP